MTAQLFEHAQRAGHPAVMMRHDRGPGRGGGGEGGGGGGEGGGGGHGRGGGGGDGGGTSTVSTQWKYYRMDPKAFLQMGLLKV